ncbi:MAG: YbaB/EbfC family nucleoid-associated protein [Chloroflexi bacterium]|nr:YbaB/EbfC family nucleoid-associated protein [Chloroflexota bacterium]
MRQIKQVQELQAKLAKAQEELASLKVEATSGGGAVKVVMDGKQKVLSIKISPEVVNPQDVELLEDMIMAAVNEAQEKSQALISSRLGQITGGLKLPGLM